MADLEREMLERWVEPHFNRWRWGMIDKLRERNGGVSRGQFLAELIHAEMGALIEKGELPLKHWTLFEALDAMARMRFLSKARVLGMLVDKYYGVHLRDHDTLVASENPKPGTISNVTAEPAWVDF